MKALKIFTIWVLIFIYQYSWTVIIGNGVIDVMLMFISGAILAILLFYNFDEKHQPKELL